MSMKRQIELSEAEELIRNTAKGTFFTVAFLKRSDGSLRIMNCRLKVAKHLKGGERAYSSKDKNLIIVWDAQKKAYRSIPADGLQWARIKGVDYEFI